MAPKRDYYEVLEVTRESSAVQVKKAYKKKALANHPDRNPGDDEAVGRFKEAAEAYEVLSDANKRARYDRHGHAGVSGNGAAGFSDLGDIFSAFGDIFGGLGGGRSGGRGGARRGGHLKSSITIDLLEAATGCTRELELDRPEVCVTCSGSGAKPGTTPDSCDYCGGHGQVVQSQGFFRVQTTCPACRGAGNVIREKCPDCNGSKRQFVETKLEVKVPAGVDNGMQLCLRGEGEPGFDGGPRGDLYVDIQVKPHPLFEREGSHLTYQVPITYTQAALGAELDVPVLDGKHLLTIPPGTQPTQVFRLKGEGMPDPHGGRRGDLHVEMHLEVPENLDERQEELLRELAEHEHANVSPHRKSFFEKLKEYFAPHEETADAE
jgi:molecular chaperone DnaJ